MKSYTIIIVVDDVDVVVAAAIVDIPDHLLYYLQKQLFSDFQWICTVSSHAILTLVNRRHL